MFFSKQTASDSCLIFLGFVFNSFCPNGKFLFFGFVRYFSTINFDTNSDNKKGII